MRHKSLAAQTEALLGAVLAGTAGHWFITPIQHPHPSRWHIVAIAAQLLAGLGLLGYAMLIEHRERADARAVEQSARSTEKM